MGYKSIISFIIPVKYFESEEPAIKGVNESGTGPQLGDLIVRCDYESTVRQVNMGTLNFYK